MVFLRSVIRAMFQQGWAVLAWALTVIPAANACQICVPYPTKSTADYVLESETVLLAREDPAKPYTFAAVEVLKGDPRLKAHEIDLLLDTTTRSRLARLTEQAVILTRRDAMAEWRRVGMANESFEPVLRHILASANEWERDPKKRIDYFAGLLGEDDTQCRSLAHLEVARAPYSEIKKLGNALTREELYAFLKNFRYREWHSLYLLFLGLSEVEEDRDYISKRLRNAAAFGLNDQLGALATAHMEMVGLNAVDFLEEAYLVDESRSQEELRGVLMALSVQGTHGGMAFRDRIVDSYGVVLRAHPWTVPEICDDLTAWGRREHARAIGEYEKANRNELDLAASMKLRGYANRAGEAIQ